MAAYAYIEDGNISEIHYILPNVWRNISNLNSLSDEELESFGWLPITDAYQEYDPTQYEVNGTEVVYQNGAVNNVYTLIPITSPSITPDPQ